MFYQKTLKNLRAEIVGLIDRADVNYKSYAQYYDLWTTTDMELIEARKEIQGYDEQVNFLSDELARNKEINNTLADENRDLVRRYDLLESVLKQLRVDIKLPRKK